MTPRTGVDRRRSRPHPLTRIGLPASKTDRSMVYARASIGANLALAAGKIALGLAALSPILIATGAMNIGIAAAKCLAVRRHGRSPVAAGDHDAEQHRTFQTIGAAVAALAVGYIIATLIPAVGGRHERLDTPFAIAITVVVFSELAIALPGAVAARRQRILMLEAIRLLNVTAALILLPVAQTALISLSAPDTAAVYEAGTSAVFGTAALLLGLGMLRRRSREGMLLGTSEDLP